MRCRIKTRGRRKEKRHHETNPSFVRRRRPWSRPRRLTRSETDACDAADSATRRSVTQFMGYSKQLWGLGGPQGQRATTVAPPPQDFAGIVTRHSRVAPAGWAALSYFVNATHPGANYRMCYRHFSALTRVSRLAGSTDTGEAGSTGFCRATIQAAEKRKREEKLERGKKKRGRIRKKCRDTKRTTRAGLEPALPKE